MWSLSLLAYQIGKRELVSVINYQYSFTHFMHSSIAERKVFWNAKISSKLPISWEYSVGVNLGGKWENWTDSNYSHTNYKVT